MIYGEIQIPEPHVIEETTRKRQPLPEQPRLPLPLPASLPSSENDEKKVEEVIVIQLRGDLGEDT